MNGIKAYSILIIIANLFLGLAYASVSNINLDINGQVSALPQESIVITEVKEKEKYNAEGTVDKYLKTMLETTINLNDYDSYIVYTVTIKNNTTKDLAFIDVIKNNDFYKDNNGNLNTGIIYELNGIEEYEVLAKNNTKTFDIKFKYDESLAQLEANKHLNSYLNFRYREIYSITYDGFITNGDKTKGVIGENISISFDPNEITSMDNLSITGTYDNASLFEGNLVIENVKSDITISKAVS